MFQEQLEALEMEEREAARKAEEEREKECREQLYFVSELMECALSHSTEPCTHSYFTHTNEYTCMPRVQDSYVDGLQGSTLYDTLFEEDTENLRLCKLPSVEEMLRE